MQICGLETSYLQRGAGEVVLFLHGWGSNKESFNGVINRLSNFYHCVSLDLWGFGESDCPKNGWNVQDYADAVCSFIKKNNYKNLHLIGHSFGGRVAIKLANKVAVIKDLILLDSAGIRKKLSLKEKFHIKRFKKLKSMVTLGKKSPEILNKFGSVDYQQLQGVMKETFVKVVNEDLTEEIKNITIRTKLIWGKYDKQTPLYMAKRMRHLIKNSTLEILDGGHFPFVNNVDKFCNICINFWEGV